jgi:hypothetical protein
MNTANTTNTSKTVNSIDLAQDIEKLFSLDLRSLYLLPIATQLAIIRKARYAADLPRIAERARNLSKWHAAQPNESEVH